MNAVVSWLKANVVTVICIAVMIGAPVAMWFVSKGMNAGVKEEVQTRASKLSDMARYEKTNVDIANPVPGNEGVSATIAVNQKFLDRYEQVIGMI